MWERRFPKIKDVIPLPNGVFHFMDYTFRAEISKDQLDFLLMASYGQRNPAPVIDLIYDEDEEETGGRKLNGEELAKLAAMMLAYYKPRWDKLAEVYDVEYDPIHNYLDEWEDESDGTHEDERVLDSDRLDTLGTTVTKTSTRTDNLTEQEARNLTDSNTRTFSNSDATQYGKTDTETDTRSIGTTYGKVDTSVTSNDTTVRTGSETDSGTSGNTEQIAGFNSSGWVDSDKSSGTSGNTHTYNSVTDTKNGTVTDTLSGTDTEAHSGTDTHALSGTDTTTHSGTIGDSGTEGGTVTTTNTGTQGISGSDATTGTNSRATDETETTDGSDHRERSGKHFGNIGNLTSQKMLKEEIELWKWNYVQSILEDARDFLTLPVYL